MNALGEFDGLGIHFVSLHEDVDTNTPNGRLVFDIFASIAQFERELTVGRIKLGFRHALSKGHHPGPVPQRVGVSRLHQLLDSGMSLWEAAAQLGISHATALPRLRASSAAFISGVESLAVRWRSAGRLSPNLRERTTMDTRDGSPELFKDPGPRILNALYFIAHKPHRSFTTPDGRIYCLFEDGEQIAGTLAAHHVEMPGTSRQRLEAIAVATLEATSEDEEPPLVISARIAGSRVG